MTLSQADIRTLRRGAGSEERGSGVTATMSRGGGVPRPRARWATRLLLPAAVLLAAGAVLVYAARDALRPGLGVYVAAVVPKASGVADDGAAPAGGDDSGGAALGAVVVQAPGWIEPAPFAVNVPALAEGVVEQVLVLEGERVEAGQVIARLVSDDARLSLRAAEAAVAERASEVELSRTVLATAESRVLVERSAAEALRDDVDRKRDLVARGAVPEGEFRQLEIRLGGLEATVATAERLVSEARAAVLRAEAARDAALVARDEAALRLSRMEVRSPVGGIVLSRLVEPGSRISMSADGDGAMMGVVLRVYDPSRLQARVDVPLADAAKVGVGTRAMVSTEALPGQEFSGEVVRVVHEANIQRNTVQFKVALEEPSPQLKPEMLARVRLHGAGGKRPGGEGAADRAGPGEVTLLVPGEAITAGPGGAGAQVWIVDTAGGTPVARRATVTTASSGDEGYVAVTSGVRLTDRVILNASSLAGLDEGVRLKILGERAGPAVGAEPRAP